MNDENGIHIPSPQRELGECPICGGIVTQKNVPAMGKCTICGRKYESYYQCENGCHFCDNCYGLYAFLNLIPIFQTESKNPIDILNTMMSDESFGLRGCVHCAAAPLSTILAFRNITNFDRISSKTLIELFKVEISRSPMSLCKINGRCGIAVACGNALANMLQVVDERYKNDKTVGRELKDECLTVAEKIQDDNLCCKRIAYLEVLKMTDFINRYLWIQLHLPAVVTCSFSEGNPYCGKEKCEYYTGFRIKQRGDLN